MLICIVPLLFMTFYNLSLDNFEIIKHYFKSTVNLLPLFKIQNLLQSIRPLLTCHRTWENPRLSLSWVKGIFSTMIITVD